MLRFAGRQPQIRAWHDVGGADGDELDLPLALGVAVALLVRPVKAFGETVSEGDRQLERLAAVAKIGLAVRRQIRRLAERPDMRDDAVPALVTGRKPERRQNPGRRRHDHGLHPQLLGERARVERPGAAVRDERELARVVSPLHRDDA